MKLRAALAFLIVPTMIACGDDDGSGPTNETVAGTYTLRTINGQALPFTLVTQTDYRLEVMSDQYVLNADGTFSTTATFRETEGAVVTTSSDTYSGTWQRDGTTINLSSVEGGAETAAFSGGNTLTFVGNGFSVVYRK